LEPCTLVGNRYLQPVQRPRTTTTLRTYVHTLLTRDLTLRDTPGYSLYLFTTLLTTPTLFGLPLYLPKHTTHQHYLNFTVHNYGLTRLGRFANVDNGDGTLYNVNRLPDDTGKHDGDDYDDDDRLPTRDGFTHEHTYSWHGRPTQHDLKAGQRADNLLHTLASLHFCKVSIGGYIQVGYLLL